MSQEKKVLLVIDLQNDFCPGGVLAVPEGDQIIPLVNTLQARFEFIIATQDWHPRRHVSFASRWGKKPGEIITLDGSKQVLWPDHCVPGTQGADFHPLFDTRSVNLILRKGTNPDLDSYSGFYENDHTTATGLEYLLKGLGFKNVYICGLATDYCVFYTALDAERLGFATYVITDASRGIDYPAGNLEQSFSVMERNHIQLIMASELEP